MHLFMALIAPFWLVITYHRHLTSSLQILLLGQHTLNEFTKGHVIDLVSNDVQRMELAARQFFRLIVAIFDVCVTVPLLWRFIGWQALMGFIFLLLLVPFGGSMIYLSGKLRGKTACVSDERINLIAEIVAGIREVKTYAWEWIFREQIEDTRRLVKKQRTFFQRCPNGHVSDIILKYTLSQWKLCFARSDWLLKLRISFAMHVTALSWISHVEFFRQFGWNKAINARGSLSTGLVRYCLLWWTIVKKPYHVPNCT